MRAFRYRRHVVVATLAATATAVLLGCQQLTSAPAPVTSVVVDNTLSFQKLEVQKETFHNAAFMSAAVSTGSFEELIKPVPVAAAAPVSQPARAFEVKAHARVEAPQESEPEQQAASLAMKPLLYESGIASTYGQGDGFEGERTGCGQIFHTHVVQVAHKSLPCGTVIRIEDTDTGKSVEAEVTDRGPYVAGRIVDLSYAAFTQLDPVGTGLLNVNVYILDTSNQYPYKLR